MFGQLARAFSGAQESPRIVDLCCSYGVNAAVLKHDLDFAEIVDHYSDPGIDNLGRDELLALDRAWYGSNRRPEPIRVCGVDSSEQAIAYASDVHLLDAGYPENLEEDDPSRALAEELQEADLITVSGGIGYITEQTIDRVLNNVPHPRLAALCLRWIDFSPVVEVGAEHGLVTERLDEATFPQRRFATDEERCHVEAELERLGIDSEGREADGFHHTDLYVLRPETEVRAQPLDTLLKPAGAIGAFGAALSDSDSPEVSIFTGSDRLH